MEVDVVRDFGVDDAVELHLDGDLAVEVALVGLGESQVHPGLNQDLGVVEAFPRALN